MVQAEDLGHRAHVLVGVDQLIAVRVVGGHAGRQLAAVLDVQQHPRHQPRDFLGALLGAQRADPSARQVIDRGNAAFVVQFAHGSRPWTCLTVLAAQVEDRIERAVTSLALAQLAVVSYRYHNRNRAPAWAFARFSIVVC